MTLSVVQTFHGFTEGEMFYPHLFLIFFITDLVHDVEGVSSVGIDRIVEADRALDGIQGEDDLLLGETGDFCNLF